MYHGLQGGFVSVDTMYISEDAGTQQAKFYKLATDVVWAEFLSLQAETVDKKNTVLLTRFKNGVQSDLTGLDLVRWEAPFTEATEQVLRHNCYKFEQINEYLFTTAVPKGADHFNEVRLPSQALRCQRTRETAHPCQCTRVPGRWWWRACVFGGGASILYVVDPFLSPCGSRVTCT